MSPQTTEMIRLNNTQYSHFLEQADVLRRSGSFCDAVVSVESQSFRAHRLVLACASRRLAQQLTPGEAGNVSPASSSSSSSSSALLLCWTCTLDLLSPRTFQQALDFAYAQTLEVPVEDLGLLLRAAQLLEMRPLEAQCRAQLQALGDAGPADAPETPETLETQSGVEEKKEGDGREEEAEEWMEETPHREREKDGRNILGEEWQRTTLSRREDTHKKLPHPTPPLPPPPSDSAPDRRGGRASPSKKRRVSHTPYGRDSVISSPYAAGHFSLPSPWGLSRGGRWTPVAALRRMTSAHFQPHQQMLAYPFPLAAPPHMYPLLASSSFPPQFHSGMADYPAVAAYGQHPLLGGGTPQLGDVAKQGPLRRKPPCQKQLSGATQTGEERYHDVHRDTTRRLSDCHHCSPSHLTNTVVQESTSTSADEACGECQPYRRGQRADKPRHCLGKPYQCILCLKRFSLKHQLDTHCRVHTGEKPFECRVCGQRSRDYSAMIKHLRTHGGATPYQCTVCLEFCSSLVAMQRHVKSHPDNDFPPDWSINKTYLYTSHI